MERVAPEATLPTNAPLLVASDVDGTLLDAQERVSQRTRDLIRRATRVGTVFTLATGRPPRWIYPVLEQLDVRPMCVCANGAVLYDSASDKIVKTHELAPDVMTQIVDAARLAVKDRGGIGIAVERAGVSAFDREDELFLVTPEYIHAWATDEHGLCSERSALQEPAIKLLLRNDLMSSAELYDAVAPVVPEELAHVTFSISEGLLECAAPGVTKALGVAELAQLIGIEAEQVIAFGDMPNDIEMLQWAGTGVAMGNARPEVKAAADFVAGTNIDDGLAKVLEQWF